MSRQALCVMLIGLSLALLPGCSRKKPTTAPEAPVQEVAASLAPAPEPPSAPEPAPEPADPLEGDLASVNEYLRSRGMLGDVYYAYDSADLSAEARQRLADNARFFNDYPFFEGLIEGHCDEQGTPEYNLALGERRANSARNYLTSLGVDGSRLRTITYGEERPVCTESEEACWAQNRRAHFLITGRRSMN